MNLAGELVLVRNRQRQTLENEADAGPFRTLVQQLNVVTNEIQDAVMQTRMQSVGTAFAKLPRIVRDLSKKLGKHIDLITTGNDVEVDKTILESLADPLTHLIRNACDHGIEMPDVREAAGKQAHGQVLVAARHEAGQIVIEIKDDGGGINPDKVKDKALEKGLKTPEELEAMTDEEAYGIIMLPGFSTADQVSDISGRGVGMDVVRSHIEELGGSLDVTSRPGNGSTFTLRLPLTLAIMSSLVCESGNQRFAIPQVNLEEIVRLYSDEKEINIEYANNQPVYRLRDRLLPLVNLQHILEHSDPFDEAHKTALCSQWQESGTLDRLVFAVVKVGNQRYGLILDDVIGTEDIVVKPMHPSLSLPCLAGSTVLGDGGIALILDVSGIYNHARIPISSAQNIDESNSQFETEDYAQLFFTAGGEERFAMPLPLIKRIIPYNYEDIEFVAGTPYAKLEGQSIRLLFLENHLPLEVTHGEQIHLIIPRHLNRPLAIVAEQIIDVGSRYEQPNPDGYTSPAILGTSIVDEHTTLFIDMYRLVELEEPSWFDGDRKRTERLENNQLRVLIAEDTPFFLNLICSYLESSGLEVLRATNGREALDVLQEHDVDLIISDIEMPIMNGFEFAREVRANPKFAETPMLALTALVRDEDRQTATEAGFNGYEMKIDRGRLLAAVDSIMQCRSTR